MTDDDERAARKWLSKVFILGSAIEECRKHRATILRLLDRPVMPRGEDVPMPVLEKMSEAYWKVPTNDCGNDMRAAIDVLHAHLTAPPPKKKVEAWVVVVDDTIHSTCSTREAAINRANFFNAKGSRSFRAVKLVEAADADR